MSGVMQQYVQLLHHYIFTSGDKVNANGLFLKFSNFVSFCFFGFAVLTVGFSQTEYSVMEGSGSLQIPLGMKGGADFSVTLTYYTEPGSATGEVSISYTSKFFKAQIFFVVFMNNY